MAQRETIDAYLVKLNAALKRQFPRDPGRVERVVAETQDHLRAASDTHAHAGAAEAQRIAIRRFGSPDKVARRFGRELAPTLSPSEIALCSYLHLGAFAGTLLVALGATCIVLSISGAVFGMYQMLGWDKGMIVSYSGAECGGWTLVSNVEQGIRSPLQCAEFQYALRDDVASSLQTWLAIGGALALLTGAAVSLVHRTLLRRKVAGEDYSAPARAHAVAGLLLFGASLCVGLLVGLVAGSQAVTYWVGASALVAALFLAGYARSVRTIYA